MIQIEPTYLRFVYDKLKNGNINSENPSSLPDGFVGIYEQEFMANIPVNERQNTLLKFGLWSLFKSAVSIEIFSLVFNVHQSEIRIFIDTYSNWFNCPEPGKYQLYHDRIKVFFLQKLKDDELQGLNEQLINALLNSIKLKSGDSTEQYALEHLSTHLALESMMGYEYERLHQFVNDESIWRRQIEISNCYEWTQKSIQYGIKEGARRHHELNTLRCTVNSVKVMHQEQNSAADILRLLNQGDYHTALKRAETWEGERQFKLYLLMIHDLTVGESKDAGYRIKACKLVLSIIEKLTIKPYYKSISPNMMLDYYCEIESMNIIVPEDLKNAVKSYDFNYFNVNHLSMFIGVLTNLDYKNHSDEFDLYASLALKLISLNKKKEADIFINNAIRISKKLNAPEQKLKCLISITELLGDQAITKVRIDDTLKVFKELSLNPPNSIFDAKKISMTDYLTHDNPYDINPYGYYELERYKSLFFVKFINTEKGLLMAEKIGHPIKKALAFTEIAYEIIRSQKKTQADLYKKAIKLYKSYITKFIEGRLKISNSSKPQEFNDALKILNNIFNYYNSSVARELFKDLSCKLEEIILSPNNNTEWFTFKFLNFLELAYSLGEIDLADKISSLIINNNDYSSSVRFNLLCNISDFLFLKNHLHKSDELLEKAKEFSKFNNWNLKVYNRSKLNLNSFLRQNLTVKNKTIEDFKNLHIQDLSYQLDETWDYKLWNIPDQINFLLSYNSNQNIINSRSIDEIRYSIEKSLFNHSNYISHGFYWITETQIAELFINLDLFEKADLRCKNDLQDVSNYINLPEEKLVRLIKLAVKLGEFNNAIELYKKIRDPHRAINPAISISSALFKIKQANNEERAIKIIKVLEQSLKFELNKQINDWSKHPSLHFTIQYDILNYVKLSKFYFDNLMKHAAYDYIRNLINLIEEIEFNIDKTLSLKLNVVNFLFDIKQNELATQIFEDIIPHLKKTNNSSSPDNTDDYLNLYSLISKCYFHLGDLDSCAYYLSNISSFQQKERSIIDTVMMCSFKEYHSLNKYLLKYNISNSNFLNTLFSKLKNTYYPKEELYFLLYNFTYNIKGLPLVLANFLKTYSCDDDVLYKEHFDISTEVLGVNYLRL